MENSPDKIKRKLGKHKSKSSLNKVTVIQGEELQTDNNESTQNVQKSQLQTEWKTVIHKRTPKNFKNLIEGTCENEDIKGISKLTSFHVCRLEPNLTAEKLVAYLTAKNIKGVICENMQPKWPELYSSFKVTVPMEEKEKICNGSTWPRNACINPFLYRLNKTERKI